MQNNKKRQFFNDIITHIKQSKCLLTGKNVAKKGLIEKKQGQKAVYGRHEDIPTGRGILYNSDMHKTDE